MKKILNLNYNLEINLIFPLFVCLDLIVNWFENQIKNNWTSSKTKTKTTTPATKTAKKWINIMKSKLFIIFFVFFVLFLFVKTTHAASNNNNAEIKLMQQQLLDAQSNAQIRNLYSIGVKMLKRMQIQNEQNAFNLDDCYERLGKFTRLMVVNNKRRALVTSNINKMENINFFSLKNWNTFVRMFLTRLLHK